MGAVGAPEDLVEWRAPLLVQAVNAVGLGDLLASAPRTAEEIAAHTGWRADLATRVLRALGARGLFHFEGGRWSLTDEGAVLRTDHPDSVAGARFSGFEIGGWTRMLEALRTGESSFALAFGMSFWDWLEAHPADRAAFDEKMRRRLPFALDMVAEYPWPERATVVDVGGGTGTLLAEVLRDRPGLRGVLFDVPATIAAAGTPERCTLVSGSFFESVPAGGDLYLLSQILHDWPDDDAVRILANVREAMSADGRVLLLEGVVDDGREGLALLDLHMLAMFGAGERDPDQWAALLEQAGFTLARIIRGPVVSWVEAVRG